MKSDYIIEEFTEWIIIDENGNKVKIKADIKPIIVDNDGNIVVSEGSD